MSTTLAPANTETYSRLQATLRELFQLDQADLDFGIYRILNQRRTQVESFLDTLPARVREALTSSTSSAHDDLRRELSQLENTLRGAGVDPDTNAKVLELRGQLGGGASMEALENEVFNLLTNFFKRYYQQGDFISLRRYKKDVYAIPYEGEEVKLHWANHDQYYIKTGEYFKQYRFTLPGGKAVHFELREASTETANNKTAAGKERRFRLSQENFLSEEGGTLKIFFTYEALDKKEKQEDLVKEALARLVPAIPATYQAELLRKAPTPKQADRTYLEKRMNDYVAKNSFDYFIHKDLGGFLRRELDFFIKNEVLLLDDLHLDDEHKYAAQLRTVRALKAAAKPVIDFLAQLEDFQKKLWLKKKFVVETNWCITLDRVPEELYAEIAANEAQRAAWVELFKIEELPNYSTPLTADFLKANPYLVLDTKFFAEPVGKKEPLRDRLLAGIEDLDGQTDGVLINSENFQALQLLQALYAKRLEAVYIDPPYNTSEESFVYKNEYKHSSWCTMMQQNLLASKKLLLDTGFLQVAIDDAELYRLKSLIDEVYNEASYIGTVAVQNNPGGRDINSHYATSHDYFLNYSPGGEEAEVHWLPRENDNEEEEEAEEANLFAEHVEDEDEQDEQTETSFRRSGGLSTPDVRPKSEFAVYYSKSRNAIVGVGGQRLNPYPALYAPGEIYLLDTSGAIKVVASNHFDGDPDIEVILPIGGEGERRVWRWSNRKKILEAVHAGVVYARMARGKYNLYIRGTVKALKKPKTVWYGARHTSSVYGTNLITDILGSKGLFSYPKALPTVMDCICCAVGWDFSATVLDYFAGSGTSAHAVLELNRGRAPENPRLKYALVEMGEYFETVTKPRVQKVIYSRKWRKGKPEGREGISQCFKTIRLESYEDVLNNLVLTSAKPELFGNRQKGFNEDTLLHYALDVESRESLLNVRHFADPFNYRLKITRHNELREERIDLVETFNYLIGLVVQHRAWVSGYHVVTGTLLTGEKVLVIWRNTNEKDNIALEDFFKKRQYNPRDTEFELIYVNGDNTLENLRTGSEHWKVRLIEEEFLKRMWECRDV